MNGGLSQKIRDFSKQFSIGLWRHPNRLNALRATFSMAAVSIPFVAMGKPYFGITLALGALAGALSETYDHPRGRLKSLSITVLSFFVASFSVSYLFAYPLLLGAGLVLSTIVFVLIGGMGERYRAISFGSILIGIYAMIGAEISPAWYWQAILLPAGALFHGLLSLLLMWYKPWRLLDEQLAKGYTALADYLENKSLLFPSKESEQAKINRDLALLNIRLVNTLERIKDVLNNFGEEVKDPEALRPYLQKFMLLQSLHERAASSHERHDKLSVHLQGQAIMEGLGEMLRQLSYACRQLTGNLLTGLPYRHPFALEWISNAISSKFKESSGWDPQLILLHQNLHRSHLSLKEVDEIDTSLPIPRLKKNENSLWERLRRQLTFNHPRMRYAIRLSIAFLIGYFLETYFELEKGAWVMLTSLFVSQITYSDTRRRLFQRLLGTITGVIIGVLALQMITTPSGQVLVMLLSALAFFYWVYTQYSIAVIFITTFVLFAFNIVLPDAGMHILWPRLIATILGASLSFIVIRLLWPGWQYRRMPGLIKEALKKNVSYLQAILSEFKAKSSDDLPYRIARREAHLADNELAQAWNSMRLEPRSKQKRMQEALTLTYLNHALLSHISALGAHRDNTLMDLEEIPGLIHKIQPLLLNVGEAPSNTDQNKFELFSAELAALHQSAEKSQLAAQKQLLRMYGNIAEVALKIITELTESHLIPRK